jgi:hypothetical protein
VLCDIQVRAGVEWLPNGCASYSGAESTAILPDPLRDKLGITPSEENELIALNDGRHGWSAVIKYIKKEL